MVCSADVAKAKIILKDALVLRSPIPYESQLSMIPPMLRHYTIHAALPILEYTYNGK